MSMSEPTVVRSLSLIVAAAGIMVMLGWIFDIPTLKSVMPQFVTMKFTTAISFVLSAIVLYLTTRDIKDGASLSGIVLIFVGFSIILIMATLIISVFFGIKTGMEDLFVRESAGAVDTLMPGRPAIATMVNFLIVAVIGLASLFRQSIVFKISSMLGLSVALIGGAAILGYLTGNSALYYNINDISTAMALNTAVLFVLLGAGFFSQSHFDRRPGL